MKKLLAPACGLLYPLLLVLGDDVIAAAAGEAPGRGATPNEVTAWALASDVPRFYAGRFIGGVLAPLALLVFGAYLAAQIRRLDRGWRADAVLAAGAVAAGLQMLAVPAHFAAVRWAAQLEPAVVAMVAVDLSGAWTIGITALALLVLLAGSVGLRGELMARWVGWSAVVLGVSLLLGESVVLTADNEVALAFLPMALLWFIWMPAASISLMRRARNQAQENRRASETETAR